MKKAFLMALACLLLTGCGGAGEPPESATPEAIPQETTDALPEAAESGEKEALEIAPAEPISAPAVVTEGRVPERSYELPREIKSLIQWNEELDPIALLAETPNQDASLYGFWGDKDLILLRWGDSLAEFDWPYQTSHSVSPQLWLIDADSDGIEELVVVCHYSSGTGVSIEQLHIIEKTENGTLADYRLPEDILCGNQLSHALKVDSVGQRTFVTLGQELIEITDLIEACPTPQGLYAGDIVSFYVNSDDLSSIPIHLLGKAYLTGVGYTPTCWYVVEISSQVSYENGTFTLSEFHLNSI